MENNVEEIKVVYTQEVQSGVYANNMRVAHTQEEFVFDFIMVVPPTAIATARVILSPGHTKRVLDVLKGNVKKFEDKFGEIQPSPEPKVEKKSKAECTD